jgi:hypothetical protein
MGFRSLGVANEGLSVGSIAGDAKPNNHSLAYANYKLDFADSRGTN